MNKQTIVKQLFWGSIIWVSDLEREALTSNEKVRKEESCFGGSVRNHVGTSSNELLRGNEYIAVANFGNAKRMRG